MPPKISVVLPTYNGQRYLAVSIQSVIDQTERDWELIIVNDGSTDGTLEIAESFARNDSRLSLISNPVNKRLPASLNIGFAKATGKYLTWTSDDNRYKPDALAEMAHYLDSHPGTDLVSFNCDYIDENGRITGTDASARYISGRRNIYQFIFANNVGAAFMYRKSSADAIGEYDSSAFCIEDYNYWYRMAIAGQLDFVDDRNIYQYRFHGASLTATKRQEVHEKMATVFHKFAPAMFDKLGFSARDRRWASYQLKLPLPFFYRLYFRMRKIFANLMAEPIFWDRKLRRRVRAALNAKPSFAKKL